METKEMVSQVKKETSKLIEKILEEGIPSGNNLEYLDKLVDIQKDLGEMEGGKEGMKYSGRYGAGYGAGYGARYSAGYGRRGYGEGSYGEGNYSEGGYGEGSYGEGNYGEGSYGERYGRRMRDSRGRFMGNEKELIEKSEEILDALNEHYGNYAESRAIYSRGNYGDKETSMQNLNYMLENVVDFIAMLKREAKSQNELDLIKRYVQTLSDM